MRRIKFLYPAQVQPDDPNYPDGKPLNDITPGDNTGTPLEEQWLTDLEGFKQALVRDAGLTPNDMPETVNDSQLLQAIQILGGQRLLPHRAAQEWSSVHVGAGPGSGADITAGLLAAPLVNFVLGEHRMLYAVGASSIGIAQYFRSLDGSSWPYSDTTAPAAAGSPFSLVGGTDPLEEPLCIAPGRHGQILVGVNQGGDGLVASLPSSGSGAASYRTPHGATNVTAVFYSNITERFLIACSDASFEYSAPAAFTGWATGTDVGTSFALADSDGPGGEFCENGQAILFAASSLVSGVTRFRIWRSTDGINWTLVFTGADGLTFLNVAWFDHNEVFIALDSDGNLYTSEDDGATWETPTETQLTPTNGASERHGTLATVGNCIAKLMNPTPGSSTAYYPGIAYSLDSGESWYMAAFGSAWGNTATDTGFAALRRPLLSLITANGRLYASDGHYVHRSGLFEIPPPWELDAS